MFALILVHFLVSKMPKNIQKVDLVAELELFEVEKVVNFENSVDLQWFSLSKFTKDY